MLSAAMLAVWDVQYIAPIRPCLYLSFISWHTLQVCVHILRSQPVLRTHTSHSARPHLICWWTKWKRRSHPVLGTTPTPIYLVSSPILIYHFPTLTRHICKT